MEKPVKRSKLDFKHRLARRYNDLPYALQRGKYLFIFCATFLAIVGFCVFYIGGNFYSILLAFQKTEFIGGAEVSTFSLQHFQNVWKALTSSGSDMQLILKNTLLFFVFNNILLMPFNLLIAFFLYKKIAGYRIFKVIFYFPGIISGVVIVTMFKSIIAFEGPIATIFYKLTGTSMAPLLQQDSTAIWVIVFYQFWLGLPGHMILFIGAMNRIPEEVIEAAKLDGCGAMREMRSIVFPLIWGTFSTMFILSFTGIFTASGPILLFTNGANKTFTISFYIYTQVKTYGAVNYPSALGLTFTLLGFPIVLFVRFIANKLYADITY